MNDASTRVMSVEVVESRTQYGVQRIYEAGTDVFGAETDAEGRPVSIGWWDLDEPADWTLPGIRDAVAWENEYAESGAMPAGFKSSEIVSRSVHFGPVTTVEATQ